MNLKKLELYGFEKGSSSYTFGDPHCNITYNTDLKNTVISYYDPSDMRYFNVNLKRNPKNPEELVEVFQDFRKFYNKYIGE
jgi:hypothetical protein